MLTSCPPSWTTRPAAPQKYLDEDYYGNLHGSGEEEKLTKEVEEQPEVDEEAPEVDEELDEEELA